MNSQDDFLRCSPIPQGHKYVLVLVSITKRVLQMKLSGKYRLEFLSHLDRMLDIWLTPEMVAAIDPMDDRGEEIAAEIRKLGPSKALDLYADYFVAFSALNPSLIAALKMSPSYGYHTGQTA